MIIAILFLFFLATVILVTKAKNRYTISFAIAFFSIIILSVVILIYTFKMSEFKALLPFEYQIYYYFRYLKINHFDISEIINAGVIIFMVAMCSFSCFTISKRKRYTWIFTFTTLFIVYFLLNSSVLYEYIYILSYSKEQKLVFLATFSQTAIMLYNHILIFAVCLTPHIQLVNEFKTTKILFRKRHIMITSFSLLVTQIIFLLVLNSEIISLFINNFDIHAISLPLGSSTRTYLYLPYFIIILSTILYVALFKFKILDETTFFRIKSAVKKSKILTSDIRHIFHSYKNALMSISTLSDHALDSIDFGNQADSVECIQRIKNMTEDFAAQAKKFLDVYNKPKLNLQVIDIVPCINGTLYHTAIPKNISVVKNYSVCAANVFADAEKLSDMFRNILINAVESIERHNANNGMVRINVWKENKWVCISIMDNGCGMTSKMKRNLFKPFYTSKNTFKNWGIGMAHVQKIVEAHLGFIEVESKLNNFTEIQVILPNDDNEGDDIGF